MSHMEIMGVITRSQSNYDPPVGDLTAQRIVEVVFQNDEGYFHQDHVQQRDTLGRWTDRPVGSPEPIAFKKALELVGEGGGLKWLHLQMNGL